MNRTSSLVNLITLTTYLFSLLPLAGLVLLTLSLYGAGLSIQAYIYAVLLINTCVYLSMIILITKIVSITTLFIIVLMCIVSLNTKPSPPSNNFRIGLQIILQRQQSKQQANREQIMSHRTLCTGMNRGVSWSWICRSRRNCHHRCLQTRTGWLGLHFVSVFCCFQLMAFL